MFPNDCVCGYCGEDGHTVEKCQYALSSQKETENIYKVVAAAKAYRNAEMKWHNITEDGPETEMDIMDAMTACKMTKEQLFASLGNLEGDE